MDDSRDSKALEHFHARAQRPNTHSTHVPVQAVLILDTELRDAVDYGRKWTHVGTAPQLSPANVIQARHRFQTFMADS